MSSKSEAIMTGNVLEESKNMYLKVSGNGFNYNFGGFTVDGSGGDEESGRETTFGCHLLAKKRSKVPSNVLTSSIDFSMSRVPPKWAIHASKGSSKLDCMKVP